MNALQKALFLAYVNWRTSDRVVARRRRNAERYMARERRQGFIRDKINFFVALGYWPNYQNPKGFNEKVGAKKVYDRDPMLTQMADKHLARDFVRDRLGAKGDEILIPQLLATNDPDSIDFSKLDGDYVIKANHGCRMTIFHRAGEDMDQDIVRARLKLWLAQDFGVRRGEWAYWNIPRKIVIERMLKDENGETPEDIKFFCFGGKVKITQVVDRKSKPRTGWYADRDLKPMEFGKKVIKRVPVDPPENLDELIAIAEKLSAGLDFVRVDLYTVQGKIYFGEMTNYPGAGRMKLHPSSAEMESGKLWEGRQAFLPKSIAELQ